MGNLIFVIVIFVIIFNSVKKAKGGSSKTARTAERDAERDSWNRRFAKSAAPSAGTGREKKTESAKRTSAAAAKKTSPGPDQELSTTEYLRQKALEDAREHAAEKKQENLRLYHETGGKMPGQRHLSWDTVPRDMKVVRCGYCGAENLIPERSNRKNYTCYFCREDL